MKSCNSEIRLMCSSRVTPSISDWCFNLRREAVEAIIRAEYNRCRNQGELAPAGKYFGRISVRRDVSEE